MGSLVGHIEALYLAEVEYSRGFYRVVNRPGSSLTITPSFGAIWYDSLDLGTPVIDEVLTPYMNANGVFDETRFHRQRAVSLGLTVLDDWFPNSGTGSWNPAWNTSSYWVQQLSRWVVPYGRYRLYWKTKSSADAIYWTDVRGAGMDAPITKTERDYRNVLLNFVSASGRIYKFNTTSTRADGQTVYRVPYGTPEAAGITFPLVDSGGSLMTFPGTSYGSGTPLTYDGTVSTGFIAQIFSDPSVATINPAITVTAPDGAVQRIGFQGLTVPAGHMVEIDTQRMTVTLMAPPFETGDSVEQYLTGPLTWPQLQPGDNAIDYTINDDANGNPVAQPGSNTYVNIIYYSAYLG